MKMQSYDTIDEYLADVSPELRPILEKLRQTIAKAAPDATEAIRYGMPTFRLNGNMVHFAAQKEHIGFYPAPDGITHFAKELAPYSTDKGTVRFPYGQPLPFDLITKIVQFRAQQQRQKPKKK